MLHKKPIMPSVAFARWLPPMHIPHALLPSGPPACAASCRIREGHIPLWNAVAERTLGYMQEEVLGKMGDFIFTAEDRQIESLDSSLETDTCLIKDPRISLLYLVCLSSTIDQYQYIMHLCSTTDSHKSLELQLRADYGTSYKRVAKVMAMV